MKKTGSIFLVIVLLLSLLSACSAEKESAPQTTTAEAVTETTTAAAEQQSGNIRGSLQSFEALLLDGGSFTPEDFGKYDITVINFWATYCGPCVAEMPALAAYDRNKPSNVNFITFCTDGFANREAAAEIVRENGLEAPVLISADGDFYSIFNQLIGVPITIFVDSSGTVTGNEIIGAARNVEAEYNQRIAEVLGR